MEIISDELRSGSKRVQILRNVLFLRQILEIMRSCIFLFIFFLLFVINDSRIFAHGADSSFVLPEISVVARVKQKSDLKSEPISSFEIDYAEIERRGVESLHDLSLITPNLYMPEYGSKMTSSIYIRGLGSRMDNAAVGMYVDRVPVLNKNGFDTDLWDIARMELLRGPQSTLYGRNTIGGIINIYTLSPMQYNGVKVKIGYSNGNTYSAKASVYHKFNNKVALSAGVNYYNGDGYFKNSYDNSDCDWTEGGSARARVIFRPAPGWTIDNSFSVSRVRQGGYAYSLYDKKSEKLLPIAYNDECGYERTMITDGLSIEYKGDKLLFSSVTGWQYLDDKMTLDQDFTVESMFTLQQAQKEHAVTQDFVLKNSNEQSHWQHLTGATFFYKGMDMDAPVRLKEDGINELILDKINNGIHSVMPFASLLFKEKEIELSSLFNMPVYGIALYHQSEFVLGRFRLTAGLRLDYEHSVLDYTNSGALHYRFTLNMPDYKRIETLIKGKEKRDYFEPLPKFALTYTLPANGNLYFSFSRGFKAGGYNTQMFSDILQNRIQGDIMKDMGMPSGSHGTTGTEAYSVGEIISYKPEYSLNYEAGGHFNLFRERLKIDAALFYINCTDQQITLFPSGQTTGRMMTNAGRTRSIGGEVALAADLKGFEAGVSYGYTNAKFTKYNDGIKDYKGKYVPYIPFNTLSAYAGYSWYNIGKALDRLSLMVSYTGTGKIYWNEENSASQSLYSLLGASLRVEKKRTALEFWVRNLTDTDYNLSYFVSVGNTFYAEGKPMQCGINLYLNF